MYHLQVLLMVHGHLKVFLERSGGRAAYCIKKEKPERTL